MGGGTKISGVAVLTLPIWEDAKRALHQSLVNKRDVGWVNTLNIKSGNNTFAAFNHSKLYTLLQLNYCTIL